MVYIAHKSENNEKIQTLKEHSEETAKLCENFAIPVLKDFMYTIGLLHDVGKYQMSFQKRINGEDIQVEHAFCGAQVAANQYKNILGHIMGYCIAGHHAGLPDGGTKADEGNPEKATLYSKLARKKDDYSAYKSELIIPKINQLEIIKFLEQDCDRSIDKLVDKLAFVTRYCFSCLTDADSINTADFCSNRPRHLSVNFDGCLTDVNNRFKKFVCTTELQKTRNTIQQQVYQKADKDAEIYLMNMPTGSGKTLCSLKFALERLKKTGKKRIIYVIPYNSIIDQTSTTFKELLKTNAEILQHQSTVCYEDVSSDSSFVRAAESSIENWDAPFIITTFVQFFESLYGNKRRQLRKLHNMSDSIIIFDEAHLMPKDYLQPCLQGISYIARYLNSEIVFLTATMPDFKSLLKEYALKDSKIVDLVTDTSYFNAFNKCKYKMLGKINENELFEISQKFPSSLIVVNTRKMARKLYNMCRGEKYHLSTYMTAYDRKCVIAKIRESLKKLEHDYPEGTFIPEERRITIISTSLIEAGVDIDVHTAFRELTGLPSILQTAGRQNREGKKPVSDMYVFELESERNKISQNEEKSITKGIFEKYKDISSPEAIAEYYNKLFFLQKKDNQKHTMSKMTSNIFGLPFKEYEENFNIIDSSQISIVIPQHNDVYQILKECEFGGISNIRKLQEYTCSVYQNELDELLRQNVIKVCNPGIYYLSNPRDYYDTDIGILFNAPDHFI